jgi:hypothetical protein
VTRPQLVEDVYRDLRDRRLLPVVALLLVAIVAIPVVLSRSGGSDSPVPPSGIVPAAAPEAQAAVLAANPGLRNYRQRLDSLKAKNPFDQQYSGAPGATTLPGGEAPAGDATSAPAGDATSVPSAEGSTETGSFGSGSDSSSGSGSSSPPATSLDVDVEAPEVQYYSFRLDLLYGPEGEVKAHKNVKLLDILNPVGTFIGATESGSRAYFLLSKDVHEVSGGECAPAPTNCEFLALKPGQSTTLTYQSLGAPEATVYRLELDKIRLVRAKKPPFEE